MIFLISSAKPDLMPHWAMAAIQKAMLQCLNGKGHIYATDVDPEESAKTKKRLAEQGFGEELLTVKLQNFCTIDEIAKEVGGFDFILADLGVSSMQIDNPKRGFSFKTDGPLDLRLNQETGISAARRLDTISREAGMLCENSDEPYCEELAKAITDEIRRGNHIDTTTKLRQVIEKTLDFLPERKERKRQLRRPASEPSRHCVLMSTMSSKYCMNLWRSFRMLCVRADVWQSLPFIPVRTS